MVASATKGSTLHGRSMIRLVSRASKFTGMGTACEKLSLQRRDSKCALVIVKVCFVGFMLIWANRSKPS
jgi:uncharacterized membrane protein